VSRSVNDLTLIGNVGNDPEIRATSGGVRVAKFSLATSWKYKGNERTDWHRVTVFGKTADFVEQFVKKGDRLYVRGRIEYNTTEDADGNKKYWTDVVANELLTLGASRAAPAGTDDDGDEPF
jgi:single-strand DNA-binding protein